MDTRTGHQLYLTSERLRVRVLMFRSGLRLDAACGRRFDRWANSRVEFHWSYEEFLRKAAKESFESMLYTACDEFEEEGA